MLLQRCQDSGHGGRPGTCQEMGRGEGERRRDSWRSTTAEGHSKTMGRERIKVALVN